MLPATQAKEVAVSTKPERVAHEKRQRDLVNSVAKSLYKAAREEADYMATLQALAIDLYTDLCGKQTYFGTSPSAKTVALLVNRPILDFVGHANVEERYPEVRYLKMEVFKRINDGVGSRILLDYQRHTAQYA